ncbi:Homeodomain-like [Penicillium roqueforti FM164]|uniref:Homeodomain-like n=1 Tax=Penicillium roqueforti (strain FM164) TaxID=1365484 RepID=W6R672_PENRF|nr:Homeodomain-like [Penicillium roqueforti FM164]
MAPINPLRAPGSHDRINSQIPSDRPPPAYPFLPSQHWRSSVPFSGHAPYFQSHFHASSEDETLLAPNELAEEVTIDCSNEFDMDFLNASSGRDANVAVSNIHTASRELPDDVSSSGLGQGLYDQRHDDFQGDGHHENNVTSSSQDIIQGGGLEQSTPLYSTSVRDGLCIPMAEEEILSQAEAYENADESTMEGDILRPSNPTIDIADGNTMVNGQIIDPAGQENQSTPTHLLSGDAGIEADESGSKLAACVIGKSMPAEKYNRQPVSESHVVIGQEKDRAAAHDNEGELQRRDAESLSASPKPRQNGTLARSTSPAFQDSGKQSPCSPTVEGTGFCPVLDHAPVLDQPSVVISNFRPQERTMKDSASITRMASPNRKRDRDEYISDDSSDDPDGPDDADYVGESGEDAHGSSVPSRRLKRARQPTMQLNTRPPRQNTKRLSVDEAVQSKVAADHTSLTSLHDIETIPIRGFLTRQILLSRVIYSVTFEEQAEHSCSQRSGRATSQYKNKIGSQHSKQTSQKGSRAGKTTGPTRFLSKDDQLLIELKEERSLPWKRIAEYFPGRSEGSLQVRYCTRLKGHKAGNSGHSRRSSNVRSESSYRGAPCEAVQAAGGKSKGTEEGVSRPRYGPPRRRQTVDRYSPV